MSIKDHPDQEAFLSRRKRPVVAQPAEDWHTPDFERRFWSKVAKSEDSCWLWDAALDSNGYGRIWTPRPDRRMLAAHRASWVMANGPLSVDLVIDHTCRNRRCVRPDHLEAVPQSVNVARETKATCLHGHPLEGLRRQRNSDGTIRTSRYCKVCDKGRKVSRRAARERGAQRERAVKAVLEKQDYLVTKSGGSLGAADLVALRAGSRSLLVQVKSDEFSPYAHFGPQAREELLLAARIAGADPVLAWWPPRGQLQWIPSSAWPPFPTLAAEEVAA